MEAPQGSINPPGYYSRMSGLHVFNSGTANKVEIIQVKLVLLIPFS